MQTLWRTPILLLLTAALWSARAAEQTAVVDEGKINVRGKPALIGEVVTQLQRGDAVTVLDYVPNTKPNEPTNWAKIKLPANTPVWVYSEMAKNGTVTATRLNLRAGPGDNYSVIGRLEKGDAIKAIRTMGDWTEIEAPASAYAFVDASLLKIAGDAAAPAPAAAPVVNAQPSVDTKPAATAQAEPAAPAGPVQDALAAPTVPAPQPQPDEVIPSSQANVSAPSPSAPAAAALPPDNASPAPVQSPRSVQNNAQLPAVKAEPPAGKRIVRREGIVKGTLSIQAPTWYELVHPQTKKTIDYLHEEKLGVNLKQFKGQKVIVSGEEAIDPRWPNTPILELETLEVAP